MNSEKKRIFTLPRSLVLKKPIEIREVLQKGEKRRGKFVNIYVQKSNETRFAVLVHKGLGKAVQRNRMKRLVREVYRLHPEWFEQQKTVFLVKKMAESYWQVEEDVRKLMVVPS